jgi:chaperonin GroES
MLKALEDRIIIKIDKEEEEVSQYGLVLAPNKKDDPNTGVVVDVGPGRVLQSGVVVPPDVAVGDKVMFNGLAVQYVKHDMEEYVVVFSKDVLAVLESSNE